MVIVEMRDGRTVTYKDATHWNTHRNQITVYGKKKGERRQVYDRTGKNGRAIYKWETPMQTISLASLYCSAVQRVEISGYSKVKKAPKGFLPLTLVK